jgi:hypothetical protein
VTTDENLLIARLIGEVQDLNASVRQLVDQLPARNQIWLEPREFARLRGCSTRSLSNWRMQGRFQEHSVRKTKRGWQFHATLAAIDLEKGGPFPVALPETDV